VSSFEERSDLEFADGAPVLVGGEYGLTEPGLMQARGHEADPIPLLSESRFRYCDRWVHQCGWTEVDIEGLSVIIPPRDEDGRDDHVLRAWLRMTWTR